MTLVSPFGSKRSGEPRFHGPGIVSASVSSLMVGHASSLRGQASVFAADDEGCGGSAVANLIPAESCNGPTDAISPAMVPAVQATQVIGGQASPIYKMQEHSEQATLQRKKTTGSEKKTSEKSNFSIFENPKDVSLL